MTAVHKKELPMSEYQAATDYISKTMLSEGSDCWAKFKYKFVDGNYQNQETTSLRNGSAVHTLALEPEKFEAEYYVLPEDYDGRTKSGKALMAEAQDSKRTVLKYNDVKDVINMAKSIKDNPLGIGLLKSAGYVESSIFWEDDGVKFKCRPDLMRNDGLIVDIKTCRSANPRIFASDAWKFKYHLSVALTCRGYQALYGKMPEEYVFLCIESEAPHVISCFSSFQQTEYSESILDIGNRHLDKLIAEYKQCRDTDVWPAYQNIIKPLSLPSYAGDSV